MPRSRSDARCRLRAAVIAVAVFAAGAVAAGNPVGATTTVRLSSVSVESTMTALAAPILGLATTPTGKGYWRVAADGGVLTAGDAAFYGSAAGMAHDTIVAIAATRTGHGYWLTDRRGSRFPFRDPPFPRYIGCQSLHPPIVGLSPAPHAAGDSPACHHRRR